MKHESLIFDLDGTLWDTAALCASAWNEACRLDAREELEFTAADLAGIMGLVGDAVRAKLFPRLEREEGTRLLKLCFEQEIVALRRAGGGTLYPGVREGLAELARTHRLFLVSNCDEPYLRAFLEMSGLGPLFADSECHGRTGLTKGENLKLVVERNRIGDAAYVGDTEGDAQAARFARLPFYFVEYGFGRPSAFDRSFTDFGSLVEAITS